MSGRKKGHGGGGGHGGAWVITFADLMALLMAFFVMIVSFSSQDEQKLNEATGSIREAFGVAMTRESGMIEREGVPVREHLLASSPLDPSPGYEFSTTADDANDAQGPEANTHAFEKAETEPPREFLTATASLRQALADMPEIAELSRQVMVEETEEGLNITIVDQDGRSMFRSGSRLPEDHMVAILSRLAPLLQAMPHPIRIVGHTEAGSEPSRPGGAAWQLSADRAIETARLLGEWGLSSDRVGEVSGVADTDPLFPDDPYLSANRRIEIVLLHVAPPLPPSFAP